jgi:hypothetical protein
VFTCDVTPDGESGGQSEASGDVTGGADENNVEGTSADGADASVDAGAAGADAANVSGGLQVTGADLPADAAGVPGGQGDAYLELLKNELALPEYETISRWVVGVGANPDTTTLKVLAGDSGADQVGMFDGDATYDALRFRPIIMIRLEVDVRFHGPAFGRVV